MCGSLVRAAGPRGDGSRGMSQALPRGEKLRRAVQWISDRRREAPERAAGPILDEAMRRFDLSPRQGEALVELLRERAGDAG